MNDNPIHFEVHRTVAGTIVEAICAMFMLALWVITIVVTTQHHQPNAGELYINAVIFTVTVVLMLFLVYHPKSFNLPKNPTERHYRITVIAIRAIAVEMAIFFLFIQMQDIGWIARDAPLGAFAIPVVLTIAIMLVKMYGKG